MTNQKHMSHDEFEKFIEVYKEALKQSDIYPCSEAAELDLRSLATYMWDSGREWEKLHKDDEV